MGDPTYTDLAVAIGRLEEGQKSVLSGIERIEGNVTEALTRVGKVEQAHAVTQREVADLRADVVAAAAHRPPWTAIAAVCLAAFTLFKQYLGF
jgi:hypothetical protein